MKKFGLVTIAALPLMLAFTQSASALDIPQNYVDNTTHNNDQPKGPQSQAPVGVPEPASLALLASGLGALGLRSLRGKKDKK